MVGAFFQPEIISIDRTVLIIAAAVIVLGGLCMVAAALIAQKDNWKGGVVHELLKDTGIALITAAIVAFLFDRAMEVRKVSDMFALVFGKDVGEAVVNATRSAAFKRPYIRENADYIFVLRRDETLPPGQALITLQVGYYVYALPDGDRNFKFIQELENYNIRGKDRDGRELPRFDFISIGKRTYEGEGLQKQVKDGKFEAAEIATLNPWPTSETGSNPRELQGLRITAKRTEIVNVPGSYNVVLSELTKGVRVHLVEEPDDVEMTMKGWFTSHGLKFEEESKKEQYHAGVLLPGQGIHLRFSLKEGAQQGQATAPTPPQPPAGRASERARTRRGKSSAMRRRRGRGR